MKFKSLILIFFLSFILIFSSCSKAQDCSTQDTKYEKYQFNTDTKSCEVSKTIKKDICGNNVIEEGETYCNCKQDVIKSHPVLGCDGTLGDYLEKSCSEQNECILIQNNKVVEKTKSIELKN